MKRDRIIVRVDEKQKEIIKANAARSESKSISDYVRQIALFGKINVYNWEILTQLHHDIREIGYNINQIVKLCNQTQNVNEKDVKDIQKEVNKLRKLCELYMKPLDNFIIHYDDPDNSRYFQGD